VRVFVAGATGALGRPLVRLLVEQGHSVVGLTRSPGKRQLIESLGAEAAVGDALDAEALRRAVVDAAPEAVIHALTAIPKHGPLWPSHLAATNQLRVYGSRNLLDAAIAAGARRFVAESMAFIYGFGDLGDVPLTEEMAPRATFTRPWLRSAVEALVQEEQAIFRATREGRIEGIALRVAGFYGPGAGAETMIRLLRRRRLPVPREGSGVGPWIHIDDAAAAFAQALIRGRPGCAYNVADDRPVAFVQVVLRMAEAAGAPPPVRVPMWMWRLAAPFFTAAWLDTRLKVSNSKAKSELNWSMRYPSIAEGIPATVSTLTMRETLSAAHRRVLELIVARLADVHEPWAVAGSTGMALQGVPVTPRDLDLQTTARGAYQIEERLREFMLEPVAFRTSERIRSHLGRGRVGEVGVEIMGDVEKRLTDGSWDPPPNLSAVARLVSSGDMSVPVLSLEYELDAYEKLGRLDRTAVLRSWLARDEHRFIGRSD